MVDQEEREEAWYKCQNSILRVRNDTKGIDSKRVMARNYIYGEEWLIYNEMAWMEYKGSKAMVEQENLSEKEAQKVKDLD